MRERFLTAPSLPQSKVSCMLVSGQLFDSLPQACRLLRTPPLPSVSGAERYHADMAVCHAGGSELFVSCDLPDDFRTMLMQEGFSLTETSTPVTAARPLLNVCMVGRRVLCNPRTAEPALLSRLRQKGYELLHTRQGYTKCAAAVITPEALITADESVFRLCRQHRIDVLKIPAGHIQLSGYDYGFIGGCCGKTDPHSLVFSGRVEAHPAYAEMRDFAANHHVFLYSLGNRPLYDTGGLLPLKEYIVPAEEI